MTTQNVVIGVFRERAASVEAIKALKESGFSDEQIGFVVRRQGDRQAGARSIMRGIVGGILGGVDMLILPFVGPADAITMLEGTLPAAEDAIDHLLAFGSRHEPHEQQGAPTAISTQEAEQETTLSARDETVDSSSAAAGGLTGGVVGAVGSALLIPGIGPAIAGGALGMAIVGAAVGGITGGFLGAFVRLGVPKDKARYYEEEFKAGHVILTIKPQDGVQEQQAQQIMRDYSVHDVETHSAGQSA